MAMTFHMHFKGEVGDEMDARFTKLPLFNSDN